MTKMIQEIDLSRVKSVYVGKNGRCCCGCAGTHTLPEENERVVKNVVRKLNKAIADQKAVGKRLEACGSYIALESAGGSTISIVYLS